MQICIRFIVVRQAQRLSYCLGQNESDILFSVSLFHVGLMARGGEDLTLLFYVSLLSYKRWSTRVPECEAAFPCRSDSFEVLAVDFHQEKRVT